MSTQTQWRKRPPKQWVSESSADGIDSPQHSFVYSAPTHSRKVPVGVTRICALILAVSFSLQTLSAQDSTAANGGVPSTYKSLGISLSNVSGLGLSYGINSPGNSRMRVTGGLISVDGEVAYSLGTEFQYELTRTNAFRVFIGPGAGLYGGSGQTPLFVFGFGVGFELPVTGMTIFENISAGGEVFYPTFWSKSGNITVGGAIYTAYNF